jgi:hypothetical protein
MANRKNTVSLGTAMSNLLASLIRDISGVYRPERYYMRGPGPKWREKHAADPQDLATHESAGLAPSKAAA